MISIPKNVNPTNEKKFSKDEHTSSAPKNNSGLGIEAER